MPEKIEVTTGLLQRLLDYIATKPYNEVWKLVADVQTETASAMQAKTE